MALDLTYDPNYGAGSGDLDLTFDPDYKPKEEPGFKSAIKRTAGQMSSAAGLAGEDVLGKNIITQGLRDWGQEVQKANPAGIQAAGDIIDRPGQWVKESTGSMLTQMGPQLAGGVAGRAIGGGLGLLGGPGGVIVGQEIGGRIGQAIPTFVQEYAGSREKQQSEGKNALSDKLLAAGAAVPATAIEFAFGPQRLLGRALEGALPEAYKQAAKGGGKEVAKFVAKEGAKQGAGEAMEEIPQGLLGDMAGKGWNGGDVFNPLTSPESWKDAGFSALMALPGGALLGGGMSGVNLAQAAKQNKREAQQPATQLPATPEDTAQMDALNADLGGAQFNYENIIPSEQKLLPPGVITVPNNAGGETVIDANAGPIQGAAVAAVTNSTIAEDIASGIPLKGYSPDQAKAELASRPDAERYEIRPHPVSGDRGRVAIVPKSAQALAEIDAKASAGNEAMARSEQLAAEEGTRKQRAQVAKDIQAAQKQAIDLHRSAASIERSITPSTPPQDAAIAREQATELRSQAAAIQTQIQTARAAQAAAATQQATQGMRQQAEQNAPATEQALAQDAAQQELAPAVAQPLSETPANQAIAKQRTQHATQQAGVRAQQLAQEEVGDQPAPTVKVPRPMKVGGLRAARYSDEQLQSVVDNDSVPATSRRAAAAEIAWRQAEAEAAAQAEIAKSTGKASTRRAGESESDWLYRKAAEKNKAKAEQQRPSEPVSEVDAKDLEVVGRAVTPTGDLGLSIIREDAMPDMDKAGPKEVSKQSATFLRHVAKLFGKEIVFVGGMKEGGFYQSGNKIYLSTKSNINQLRVLGHEMLHALKRQNRASYDKLLEAVGAIATDAQLKAQFKDYFALDAEMNQKTGAEIDAWLAEPKNREMILEEMMADLSGNRWAESSFWESVFTKIDAKYGSEQAKGIIAKLRLALVAALNKLMSLVKGGQFSVDARVSEHLESIREALATGFADYAKAVKDGQISESGVGEVRLSKSKPTMFSDIKRGQKIEQAEPLSEKQWAQVREIALEELPKKDGQRAIDAERDYLANEALANRDSERYKEVAREKLGSMAVPQLSTVPVMEGKVRPVIVGTGKNNKTRVFDVARVMRKRILARAADISNPEGRERIARALVHEALYSLSMDGHAVGWYDRKVSEALAVTAMAHPEILTNKEANLAFRIIAAVTSNGQAVRDNFILANEIYKIWRSTGQFPVEFDGGGARVPAMKAAFAKMNVLVKDMGFAETERELMTMRSVREIEQEFDLKINGELMDAMVPTAVGLGGPKIGNFFANLSGYFDSPTMDLWFMRTIGRMTGGIIATKPGLVKHLDNLLSILPESGEVKGVSVAKMRKEIAEYKALSDEQRLDPEITIKVLGQVEKYGRAQYAEFAALDADGKSFTKKTPENENARALKSNLSALVEAPSNGTQRDQLRQVVNRALTMLDKNGIKLNAADLQAVLWYYEKSLYAKLGDVNESAKPWDYASAARFGVGWEYGLVDVGSSKRAGQVRDGQSGVREDDAGGVSEEVQEPTEKFSKARINFEVAPNPDDVALTNAWNELPESKRHQLSVSIATDITNRAMRLFAVTGTIKEQQGGFEEETNTSFQLILDQPEKTGDIQNFIGYVLSQKSMVAVSEESFPGSEKTGVVTVSIGNADPQAIYRQLRGIKVDGNQPVSGHSTAAGKMAILNYSDVSTEELARLIDSELRGKFYLHIDEVYTSFPEAEKTEDYGYGNNRQAREAASGRPPLQRDADNLRRTATELIRKELKFSPARYEQPATDGGVAGQDRPSDRRLGQVDVTGTHYSREQRQHLSGVFFGTGLNAEEGKRIQEAKDQRLKSRLYAYVNEGQGVFPEAGVGAYAHTVKLDNLYDLKADPLGIRQKTQDANDRESLILDAGFDGYYAPGIFGRQGVAILMGGAATRGVTPTSTVAPAVSASEAQKPARRTDLPLGQMTGAEWKKLEPRATDLEDGKSYYRSDIKFSPGRVQSENELPDQQPGNRTLDGAELKALRRAASRLEDPERGVTFRVTEDGQAIVTGPARFHIPDRFQRFAEENGLTFKAERGSARMRPNGEPERTRLGAMPENYRGDGALYAQEMRDNYDRTGLARFSPAREYIAEIEGLLAKIKASDNQGGLSMVEANLANIKRGLAGEIVRDEHGNLLAPNGRKSKLTEKQYLQVRTPAFRKWFGDWLSFHNAKNGNGVWTDGDKAVSKIVDENGEPLVVYHGTEKGGFTVMRPDSGDKHRLPMLFAAATRQTARTYSWKGDEINLNNPVFDGTVIRKVGKDWFVVQKSGDPSEAYNVYGDLVDVDQAEGYVSKKEAEYFRDNELEQYLRDNGDVRAGIYSMYLNLRNPAEEDFEGANWNGDAFDLHEVLDANGDNIYADDGRRLMPQDEAEELAEQNEGAEVSSVEWIGETTNTVAEDAKRMGNDGAIIRQVEDDGGRYPGGVLRPDDVFVFFDSNQAKSATQNTGAFSQKNDDLRYSPPRWYFSPLEKAFESAPDKVFGQAPQVKLWLAGNKAKLGLKDDEIFWTGINDWLDMQGKQKVSKADVLGYLAGSGVQVEEVMKGESGLDENGGLYVGSYDDEWAIYRTDDGDSADPVGGTYASQEDAEEDLLAMQNDNPTKFGQYTLPGGTNYRELLLTLPAAQKPDITASQEENDAWRTKADKEYRSGHWQEPNILAHIRMNDRTDADGNKVLFIEEVQSDWGQEGKRRGFLDGNKARYEAEYRDYADELMAKYGVSPTSAGAIMSLRKAMSSDERAKLKELNDKIVAQSASVQSAPFVTDTKAWLALAVKRIMAYAAANGYEKVAFIDGQQSTDRYWKHELIAPAVDRWNEITKPESVRELGDNIFGREMYSLMSLNHMDAGVLPMVKHDQVRKSIVSRIPVDVVDVLSSNGVKAEELFSNGDVVFDRLPVSYRSRAATAFGAAIGQTSASIRAKLSGIESGGSDFEVLPALRASDLGPRELVGILDPQRLFHGGSGLGSEKTTPASAVAKSALLEKGDGLKGQFGSAELAKLLNAHVELRYGREGLLKHSVEPEPGQGMKTFYDRIVPQVVSDQLKKVGGKMEGVRINTKVQDSDFPDFVKAGVMNAVRTEQLAFTVTPKMSEPLPLFSTRRALDGYFSDNDHVVPDIAPWTTNTQLVDLAYLNGKPIRLNVGRDNGPGSGFGAMHIARNEDRDPRRAVEKETDDRGENVVRSVLKALSTAGGILHKNGEKYVLRLPMANKALVLADNGNHYSVITVLPAAQNKYGVADWTGRLTFPATADATSAEPLSPTGAKSSLASRSGMGSFVSARFDIKPPTGFNQPTTRVVVRKTRAVDPEAMAADGIKRSTPRSQMTGQPILGTWAATEVSSFDNIARQLQDKQIDTKRVVAEIRAAGKAIHDAIDPYLQEILYHGRAAKRTQDFAEQELRPLLQGMQLRGVSMQEIEDYLWAKHAPERNAQNAKTGFTGAGSGLTDAEARTILSGQAVTKNGRDIQLDAAKMPTYAALAQQVKAINDKTLDALVAYGLETQATIDQWKKTYQNYVPLMRDMTDDNYSGANNRGLGTGKGVSVRGAASKRALGSERGVIDIVANIAMQRERAITRGEKSRVSQATYGLAVSAPNPDFWLPIDPAMAKDPTAVARMESALIQMGIHPIDAQNIAREPVQSYIDPRTGMAATRINPVLRGREDVLATRINGEDKFLLFSSDERAQNMVRNLKNLDDDQLGGFLQTSAKITRWFAAVNTQYNPVFGLVNGVRDFGSAMLNLSSTPLQGKQKRVAGYGLDALRGIYADLRDHRAGRATSSRWALEFEEFAKEGGQTGYRDMFNTSEQRTEALADELKALSQGNGKWLKINEKNPVFAWLSDYNTAVENAFRVAAYKVAKESGMSKQQAAALAKNLTVNFNKKGLAATQTGALYAFFNAAVQGTARIGSTLLEHRGDPSDYRNLRLSSMGKKIVLGGVMLGVMQALMGALAGWDDDEPKQFQRERNLIIPLPGTDNYVSIPYPLGFHVLPNVGRIVTEFALSGFKDPGKRLTQLLGSMSEAFNPLGSSGLSLQTIAPTFADPLVALATNTDWNGQKIAKEDFNQNHPTPGWSRTKDTATPWSKALAYGLNYISGGGEYGKGLVSPTPDQIDYLIGQAIGGVGREAGKVAQTVTTTAKGEELPMYKIPVVGRFAGETTGVGPESGKYYDNLQRVGEHADPIKRMREDRKNAEVMEYFKAHPEARLIHAADKAQRDISELRTVKRKLEKAEAPQERINAISEQIKTRMRMFNNQVKLLEKEAA